MKIKLLQIEKAIIATLFILLLNLAGMTNVKAKTPYRQYADNGILLNFHEIDNVDFRVFLLYNLSQDDRFILVENEESGLFSIVTNDETDATDFYDSFETFYQNTYSDFQLLSKTDIDDRITVWKSQIAPQYFTSIMMDVTLRRSRSGENETCINAVPFCTSDFYEFEAACTSQTAEEDNMDDGCIASSYNPSWYYMRIGVPGQFIIHMEGYDPNNTGTRRDIDFCLWGPYTEEQAQNGYACTHLTADKIIDCSYSAAYSEDVFLGFPENEHQHGTSHGSVNYHVPQTGEYYLLMITNYSRQPCVITFSKVEGSGPGTTDYDLLPPLLDNNGPYCEGETIQLSAIGVEGAIYNWTGPNGFSSSIQNPRLTNCTMDMAGIYTCTITRNGQTASATTEVVIVDDVLNANYSATACDSYIWHGIEYTSSGSYVYSTETAQGCQRIETLDLTINNSETEEFTVTDCDSYTWHGQTYTESGTYTFDSITDQGCQRIEILHLTIGNHWAPVDDGQYAFSMTLWGVIQINGEEQYSDRLELGIFSGDECRGVAMAQEFFLTHRYLVEANVYGDSGEQLTFKLYDHRIHRELDQIPPDVITFTIDGYGTPVDPYVLNFISYKDITATTAPENAGMVIGTGEYTMGSSCTLTATANPGFQFQSWTLNGTVVSTSPTYTFTVTGVANYVAHFQYVQSRDLVAGWNWWSTYIEQEGNEGLTMLENSLGTSGIRIQGKNNSVDYFEYQGTDYWYGALNVIANEQMYMIRTSAACDAVIVGDAALPSNHPITINGGWNWVGYPNAQNADVNVAMSGFTPEANDVVKGRNSVSTYISYGGYQGWYGQLNTLEPGQGYMYRSYSNTTKTLTFQTGRGEETKANITPENNVFVPTSASNYADNMIVTAVIDMEGEELRSEDYELAAFAGDECRGSVKLMYVEPFDRYVALLMAYGEGEEELRFVLTGGKGASWSHDRVTYTTNGTVGTMTEPAVLHFGPLGIEDNLQKPIHVYPNPSKGIFNIEGEDIQKIEVIDAYGQVILSKEVKNTNVQVDLSNKSAGAYLLRVVTDDGMVTHKLVNRK